MLLAWMMCTGAVRFLGNEADWRETEDHEKSAVFIIDPSQGSPSDGFVTGWHVYTTRGRRSQVVHLQVWRPTDDRSGDGYYRYRRVGETVIAALWVGHNFFALYPADRIPVLRGDVLGIYFPSYNPIPWTSVPCRHGNEHLLRHVVRKQDGLAAEMSFEKRGRNSNPCRRYSLNATIMDEYGKLGFCMVYRTNFKILLIRPITSGCMLLGPGYRPRPILSCTCKAWCINTSWSNFAEIEWVYK